MTKRRQFLTQASAATAGLALSSCGWRLADVRSYAASTQPSDELYIWTWAQYTDKELLQTFTAQTGIKVIANVYDSNETMLAKLQAGGGRDYSIIYPSDYAVRDMSSKGLLTKLEHSRLLGLDNLLPRFQNPSYDPGNHHSLPFSWGTTGLIYNTQKLEIPPDDWAYLWQNQQKLSQRMTVMNDQREVIGATLRMLGYSYNSQSETQVKQAYEMLKRLKPAISRFDTDAWQNELLAGDLYLAMCYSADGNRVSKENPSLKYTIPRSGSSLWTDTIVIPKTAPNINGAYAWMNFILQPEVAAGICKRLGVAPPNQAAIELLPQEIKENANFFPSESLLAKCERIMPLEQFNAVYDRYWTQLTSS